MHLSLHHLQEAEAVRLSVYASQSQCLQKRGWSRWVSEHPQLSTICRLLSMHATDSLRDSQMLRTFRRHSQREMCRRYEKHLWIL
jgi:hypothetical protein